MASGFETRDDAPEERLRPLKVPVRSDQVFESAREMVDDLDGWELVEIDVVRRVLTCRKRAGILGGTATITIRCEGPEGLPSTVVHVRSTSSNAILARDRAHVLEFLGPFHRRVC
jgi:hypothetical protein